MSNEPDTSHPPAGHGGRESGMPAVAGILGAILGVVAVLIATVALISSGRDSGEDSGAGAEKAGAPARSKTFEVELGDFFVHPENLAVEPDTAVTLTVTNTGGIAHDLSVKGGGKTPLLNPGEHATLKLENVEGRVDLFCSVPGHADAGMRAAIAVTPGSTTPAAAKHKMTSEEMDKSYLAGVQAFPAKTKGQGNVDLQPLLQDGFKVFDLTADEIEWEVAPNDVRRGMAYNGMIPGPAIRVNVGDKIRVVLHNKLDESTAIHFHGMTVPNAQDGVPGITQPLVKPGESFTYEFTVRNSGSNMYHSHMNGATQIPAGLLGALVVADPSDAKVDHDELMILNDGPLGYTLNGKGFPATQPIVVKRGERVRVRYMNEGLQIHPMHLHGMVQTVITKDGHPLPQPYIADTVLVAPGERVDVIVEATEVGAWAYHCHILTHAETEAGMFGMVTAMIVQ
ncbi:MAG: hypothetical protein EPO16_01765 [Dehalococcoidia bacterium]|nr:MAG: hypothetical protein EPO16_01765 [Dehalococcoidia bacterium]